MSAPSSSNSSLPLTGGMPTKNQDIAPSVIFIGLYLVTAALCLFRMLMQYRSPRPLLLTFVRLMVFETVRVATFIVRIMGAVNYSNALKGTAQFNETFLIVEQILISIGYLMPAAVLVKLVGFHSARAQGGNGSGRSTNIIRLLELAITGAIILGVVAGVNVNKAQTDPSTAHSVKTERTISSVIVIVVLALAVVFCASLLRHKGIPTLTTIWLGATSAILIIVPVYRIANTAHPPADSNSTGSKIAFYVFQISVEWIVGTSILALNAKKWCGIEDDKPASVYGAASAYNYSNEEEAYKLEYNSGRAYNAESAYIPGNAYNAGSAHNPGAAYNYNSGSY